MGDKTFAGENKEGKSLFFDLEVKLANWLIKKIPPYIEGYHLTLSSIIWCILAVTGGFLAKYDTRALILTFIAIVLHYIADLVDGKLGKYRNTGVRRWGYYVDHFLDYVFLCSLLIGFSFIIPLKAKYIITLTLAILGGFMVHAFLQFGATNKFKIYYYGIGPTEIQLLFAGITLSLIFLDKVFFVSSLPYVFLLCLFGLIVVVHNTQRSIWEIDLDKKQKKYFLALRSIPIVLFVVMLFFILAGYHAYRTNPYNGASIFADPFEVHTINNEFFLEKNYQISTKDSFFSNSYAYFKSAFHIASSKIIRMPATTEDPAKSIHSKMDNVLSETYQNRFDIKKPYLITGGHFSVLYPRNLGVFYYSTIDPYGQYTASFWDEKQILYSKTVAFSLEALSRCENVFTTIVPIDEDAIACINIYDYPSDTLYGILFGINALINSQQSFSTPIVNQKVLPIKTKLAGEQILEIYRGDLKKLLHKYLTTVQDPNTQLVRSDINLSSAKDTVKRQGSFYDNVILWKTLQLSSQLGIEKVDAQYLANLKQEIIRSYWNKEKGYFNDDLTHNIYSSDWMIVHITQFLDVKNPEERRYYEKAITYIEENNIAQPFPIKYHETDEFNNSLNIQPLVRLLAPNYQTDSIWSFWGTEYIKILYLTSYYSNKSAYFTRANEYLNMYVDLIQKNNGMPEVFDSNGNVLEGLIYSSVPQTGWIVNIEKLLLFKKSLRIN